MRSARLLAAVSATAIAVGLLGGVASPASAETASADDASTSSPDVRDLRVRELKGGVCAGAVPEGLVRFAGPAGIRLTARVRRSGDARLLTIVSGTGRIGGVVIRPKDVSGELTWRSGKAGKGSMTGSVSVRLAEHAKVSRTWAQTVEVTAAPQGCDWSGSVQLAAQGVGASLDLRGPLGKDGSYQLRGSGSISLNRVKVPVTGSLRASNTTKASWRINGQTKREVRFGGARVSNIRLSLTDTVPAVKGAAVVHLDEPRLSANAVLEVAGADTWRAVVAGSNRRAWVMPQAQMAVQTGKLSGSIGVRAGQQQWLLTAPGAVKIGDLDYITTVGFAGPATYTVQATGAVGRILGFPDSRPFTGIPTKLTVTPKGITGALTVATPGNLLLDLKGQWRTATDYILRPAKAGGWSFDAYISHAIRAGKGTIRLSGPIEPDGSVSLVGSGTMDISGTRVPVRGYYKRTGFTNGSTPVWALAAYPSEAPGGRIPLDGGAGFVGGVIVFNGTGAQPVSTIPAPQAKSRAAAPRSAPIVSGGQTLSTVAYDGFDYPAGHLGSGAGGTGWTGSWYKTYSAGGNAQVQTTGLTYAGLDVAGGSVTWGSGGNEINGYGRTLPAMSSGVVYLQFLSNFGSQTGGGTPTVRLVDDATGATTGGIGNNGAPNMAILNSSLAPVGTSSTSMNGNLLTVVRIDYGAGTTSMWVNPNLAAFDYANPPAPNAQATGFAPAFSRIDFYVRDGQVYDEINVMVLNPAPAPVTVTGNTTVQLSDSDNDTFYLPVSYTYTDPNNWTATVNATTPSNLYNPFDGLQIPETDFSGTVTDTDGQQTWNVSIAMQTWQDMANGVDYQGAFTISNSCPLSDQSNCPDSDGIYVGGQSNLAFDDASIPPAYADGAFLTDLTWGWWDATITGSVSFNGITMANPDLTIWKGAGSGPDADIVLPDLSDLNGNGLNLEFCANFTVPVPDVATINTLGCAEWTEQGVIMAQVNTGGDVATGDYNGVTVSGTTITSYVWNGLDSAETVFVDGVEVDAEPDRNYLTADVVVPGNVMHDFGTGSSVDATINVTGWFDTEGDFDLEGTIPVNLKGGGFTLEEILISISRQKEDEQSTFDLRFDAECDVVINGNHFPLDVYIGYQKATDSTITVGLSATGTQSTQPEGTMDFVNLVPSGDFEPENASLVDGSFDGKLPANIADDGGFERSTDPGDIAVDGSFDDSSGLSVLPDGDFESGAFGNILVNGDFEDSNLLVNGGFEENGGSLAGWLNNSGALSFGIAEGTASSDSGPEDQGSYVAILNNNSASNNKSFGLTQIVPNALDGSSLTVTAWVRSNGSGNAPFHIKMESNLADAAAEACGDGVTLYGKTVTATPDGWTQASVSGTLDSGCFDVQVTLVPENPGTSVQIDAVEMSVDEIGQANSVGVVARPNVVAPFDSLVTTPFTPGYTSGVSIATDYPGTLRTDGKQAWMLYSNTTGYTFGDFDVTYKVMFPTGSSDREIADFGFWLDGDYNSMKGYCFRLQTANGDGGFFNCTRSSKSPVSGMRNAPDVTRGHWYQVRLSAVSGYVTAYVIDLSNDNALFFTQTLRMPSTPGGVFGQVPDGVSSSTGIRWDDIAINGMMGEIGWEDRVYSPTQVVIGAGAHSGEGRASLFSNGVANAPFEYAIDDTTLAPGQTYTYSTWLRAGSGTVSGSISLAANGGTSESAKTPFTVGTTWTQVATTLTMRQSGHTELRPRITVGTTNAELQVDDQVLQLVPWWSNQGNSQIQVTQAEAHGGTNSLQVVNPGNSSSSNAFYTFTQMPKVGSVLTVTAWVKSPAGVPGNLFLWESSGSNVTSFTGTGSWQEVTVSRTMQGSTSMPDVGIDVGGGHAGQAIYVDDVQVVVSDVDSTDVGALGAPSAPGGWLSSWNSPSSGGSGGGYYPLPGSSDPSAPTKVTATANGGNITVSWSPSSTKYGWVGYVVTSTTGHTSCSTSGTSCTVTGLPAGNYAFFVQGFNPVGMPGQVSQPSNVVSIYQNVAPVVVDNASIARSKPRALMMQPPAKGKEINTYSVTPQTAPEVGSTWQASLWIAPGTSGNTQSVTVTAAAGSNSASKTMTLSGTPGKYTNVVVPVKIASAASTFTVQITYSDAAGTNPIYIDDVSITEAGLTPVDAWTPYAPTGFLGIEGVSDATNAYSGDGYLQLTNAGTGGGAAYLDGPYRPVSGKTHEMSFWIKSPQGNVSGVAAWVRTQDSGGTILDSYQMSVPVTGNWTQVFLSLPIKNTNAVDLRTEFDLPPGVTIWVDDVETRDVNYWSAAQPSSGVASVTIIDGVPDAANGQNYLRFSSGGANGGMSDVITADTSGNPIDVIAGSSYKLEAYVRSTTGASVTGTMSLATGNGSTSADSTSVTFTAGSSWTPVELMLDTTKNANTMIPKITLNGAGMLDVDELTLVPVLIEQTDPWSASGSGVTWGVYDDPPNAYDSSYGVMEFSVSEADTGVQYVATQSTSVGDQLSATAFVRTGGAEVSGTFVITSKGGTKETWQQDFTADGDWQSLSIPIVVAQSGHTGFTVQVLLNTTGQTLYLDQVALQTNPWTPSSGLKQAIVFDGNAAQSGSGYLELTPTGSGGGSSYLDMAASDDIGGSYPAGSAWIATAYVRSSSASSLATGKISLGASSGSPTSQAFSVGSEWTAVPVSYTVGGSDLGSLRVTATVNGSSVPIEVDSVTISDGTPPPDGITTPLPHPESGWVYLWNDAFGIPGHHLWAISAQVDFEDGLPGLGVASTVYQDPTRMPNVMTGTDWLWGNMAMNISESDPCFLYEFSSQGGNSGVSLGTGVFTANDFSINFAPRGCQVGPDTLPKGASLSFDGQLGDGSVSFDLAITEGEDGPEFTEDIGIADITIGGFDFKEMDLNIFLSPTDDSITFVGDMATPMGNFNGSYDLNANESELVMDGSVSLTDWGWAGGGFDVEEFDYDMSMTVPFGAGECGSFSEDASGLMDMGKKTSLSFTGKIAMDCGKLEVLQMDYDYHHGSITEVFELNYDSSTGILAGEVEFDFERSSSWKHFFHRYNRHPKFAITLAYSMDVDKPSTASATLTGEVSVSGGDGSISCTLEAGSGTDWKDDQCSLHVHLNIGGGHTYNASW